MKWPAGELLRCANFVRTENQQERANRSSKRMPRQRDKTRGAEGQSSPEPLSPRPRELRRDVGVLHAVARLNPNEQIVGCTWQTVLWVSVHLKRFEMKRLRIRRQSCREYRRDVHGCECLPAAAAPVLQVQQVGAVRTDTRFEGNGLVQRGIHSASRHLAPQAQPAGQPAYRVVPTRLCPRVAWLTHSPVRFQYPMAPGLSLGRQLCRRTDVLLHEQVVQARFMREPGDHEAPKQAPEHSMKGVVPRGPNGNHDRVGCLDDPHRHPEDGDSREDARP